MVERKGMANNKKSGMKLFVKNEFIIYYCIPIQQDAQVAELVDALVSNTNVFTDVPVRLRPWVQKQQECEL